MDKKSSLGQFFTTNFEYILQNFEIPDYIKNVIEPFAGNCDLLNFLKNNQYNIELYDIDPKKDCIVKRDTLLNPPDYTDRFILTNPPYLARNKSKDKTIFNKYNANDLYKCFIKEIIKQQCLGGIIIIPLNFLSSIRKSDIELRKCFVNKFNISRINIFEERVFDDTSYSVCSMQFEKKNVGSPTKLTIFPSGKRIECILNENNNYTVGGEIYSLCYKKKYTISRLLSESDNKTNINLKCIDDNIDSKICLSIVDDKDVIYDKTPNKSARSYATLVVSPMISLEQQKDLVYKFNNFLNGYREKYNSLFLSNYRESNSIARKRISFSLAYDISGFLLSK